MKTEEKIEIMFESVLKELEEQKKIRNHSNTEADLVAITRALDKKMESLTSRIMEIKIPVYTRDFHRVNARLDNLKKVGNSVATANLTTWKGGLQISLFISISLNLYLLWKLFA